LTASKIPKTIIESMLRTVTRNLQYSWVYFDPSTDDTIKL